MQDLCPARDVVSVTYGFTGRYCNMYGPSGLLENNFFEIFNDISQRERM